MLLRTAVTSSTLYLYILPTMSIFRTNNPENNPPRHQKFLLKYFNRGPWASRKSSPSVLPARNMYKQLNTDKFWMLWRRAKPLGEIPNEIYLQWSFSSRFPRDVTDKARMNSSNSIEPSWKKIHFYSIQDIHLNIDLKMSLCFMISELKSKVTISNKLLKTCRLIYLS